MAIDTRYIASADLQEYLVDKDTGLPLAGGFVFFYEDNSRTVLKDVYTISGNAPNYTFTPLPNPIVLSAVGTIQDNNGRDVIPYYFPFVSVDDSTPDLYYVVVQNSLGVPQFTREAWPPNAEAGGSTPPGALGNLSNYIPNGQFLTHNTINPNNSNILGAGSTAIAPGGWTFELPNPVASTNILTFVPIETWTDNPPESPPFQVRVQCTAPSAGETPKSLRIKFNDVNKFANDAQFYTFGFSAAANTTITNVNVNVVKYFGAGGTVVPDRTLETFTITNNQSFFSVSFSFEGNPGDTVGTGQTFVALDIAFNANESFDLIFTDFVLIQGEFVLNDYPVQTNADTIARSIFGWADLPDPTGQDLYLPPVLTPYGMTWDQSIIGKIQASTGAVTSPNSTSPLPIGNDMPCDGASYISANFSAIDIPYSRLGNYLIAKSPVANTPMYGTGLNFATAYADAGNTSSLRLTVNSSGAGINPATGITTPVGWTFTTIPIYNGSSTGSASLNYTAVNNVANTVLAYLARGLTPANSASGAGAPSFTVTNINLDSTTIIGWQYYGFTVLCAAASTLVTGTNGRYIDFSNASVDFRLWYNTGTETAPATGGRTLIEVNVQPTDTAQDVANITREIINAYQSTLIIVNGAPTEGSYLEFQTNPASTINYFVWYSYITNSIPPTVPGRIGIKVLLPATPTNPQIVTDTLKAINAYQYAAPDFRGMFLRGADFSGTWDLDVAQRWSSMSGLSGAQYGTFEFQQIISHYHIMNAVVGTSGTDYGWEAANSIIGPVAIQNAGGNETRPVNAYVEWVIKY